MKHYKLVPICSAVLAAGVLAGPVAAANGKLPMVRVAQGHSQAADVEDRHGDEMVGLNGQAEDRTEHSGGLDTDNVQEGPGAQHENHHQSGTADGGDREEGAEDSGRDTDNVQEGPGAQHEGHQEGNN